MTSSREASGGDPPSGPVPRFRLELGGAAIELATDDLGAADAAWLAEFLEPWFARASTAAWRVRLSIDREAFARLCVWRGYPAMRACFVLDREVVELPARLASDVVCLADVERSCFVRIAPGEVEIIAHPAVRTWRLTLMRVFREIAVTRARRSALDLHAACVASVDGALLICGPKEAGKSTLATHLMRHRRCGFVANDRVLIHSTDVTLTARGIPSAIRIRSGTLAAFPELLGARPDVARPCLRSLRELAALPEEPERRGPQTSSSRRTRSRKARPPSEPPAPDDMILSPAQLLARLDALPVVSAPLGAIAFPSIERDVSGVRVKRLASEDTRARIWESLYGCAIEQRPATIFEELGGGKAAPPAAIVDRLAETVPAYAVSLGPDAYSAPFGAALLRRLLPGA